MPIQCPITQDTGVVATYHVIARVELFIQQQTANASLSSWLDQAHFASGAAPIATLAADITPLSGVTPQATLPTFGQQIIQAVELFLLTTPQFTGGTQVG